MTETSGIPGRARVVIIGGGVIGTSVAYHLAAADDHHPGALGQARGGAGWLSHLAGRPRAG